MLGYKSGFKKRVKKVPSNAKGVYRMIPYFALASKPLTDEPYRILEAVVKCFNLMEAGDLKHCRDMDSDHEPHLL